MSEFIDNTEIIEVEEQPTNTSIALETNDHNLLTNRHSPDQHTIGAITGLSDELRKINELKSTQYTKNKGYAEYWPWYGEGYGEHRPGRFVSLLHTENDRTYIELCQRDDQDVFGVTVWPENVAFIGNEEWEPVKDAYDNIVGYKSTRQPDYEGLVCLVGTSKISYLVDSPDEINIRAGEYIKPTSNGYAIKAENNDGLYRVIGIGYDDYYGWYVEINLSISASDAENISVKHAKTADNYTDNGTIKQGFDDVNNRIDIVNEEIDNIEDGTTIVSHASAADSININNINMGAIKPYDIKICEHDYVDNSTDKVSDAIYIITNDTTVDDLVDWKNGVDSGEVIVPKSQYSDNTSTADYAVYAEVASAADLADEAIKADHAITADNYSEDGLIANEFHNLKHGGFPVKAAEFAYAAHGDQHGNIIDETYATKTFPTIEYNDEEREFYDVKLGTLAVYMSTSELTLNQEITNPLCFRIKPVNLVCEPENSDEYTHVNGTWRILGLTGISETTTAPGFYIGEGHDYPYAYYYLVQCIDENPKVRD